MPHSHHHSFRSLRKVPLLCAITHDSTSKSFEDGILLPSSCHSRTWLLDNFQETYNETLTCQPANCEQHQCKVEPCVQSSWVTRAAPTTCSSSKTGERPVCQSGTTPAVPECASQPCQSRHCQQVGFVAQSYQPATCMAMCSPLKSTVSESCRSVEFDSNQCCSHVSESSSCNSLSNAGPQPADSSSTYEPTCCVTGGSQLPSK